MHITYGDIIKYVSDQVEYMEHKIPSWKVLYPQSGLSYDHKLATAKRLLKLLKRCSPDGQQANLFDEFKKMK